MTSINWYVNRKIYIETSNFIIIFTLIHTSIQVVWAAHKVERKEKSLLYSTQCSFEG